ncbi:MAG: PEP/pyruvate-binding domain-containing protein, partial [Planctomycetota bacterium]
MRLLGYEEAIRSGVEVVGAKALNLARLARYGFAVPEGFVVPAEVYRQRLGEISHDRRSDLEAVRDLLRNGSLHGPSARSIEARLEELGWSKTPLAVRSSAVGEDGTLRSFAGIHASRLHVL